MAQINSVYELSLNPHFHQTIEDLWDDSKGELKSRMSKCGVDSNGLYYGQSFFEPLLRYTFKNKRYHITDELLELFQESIDKMIYTDKYIFSRFPENDASGNKIQVLNTKYYMWANSKDSSSPGVETVLSSAQFLAMISYAIFEIEKIHPWFKTTTMKTFKSNFIPILTSHYKRWVLGTKVNGSNKLYGPFERRSWGCTYNSKYVPTSLTHKEVVERLIKNKLGDERSKSYCNAALDTDLWIISGVSTLLAAHKKSKTKHMSDSDYDSLVSDMDKYGELESYLESGFSLLRRKMTETTLTNFSGQSVKGLLFGKNDFDDLSAHAYSGYTNSKTFPTVSNQLAAVGTGWDLNHGRRFISVFSNLYDVRNWFIFSIFSGFPSDNDMKMLSNQFVYKVFNKNFTYPSFSNYYSGINGWYRVNRKANGGDGFGYGPSDMSISILEGMYGEYFKFNPNDVNKVMSAVYNLIHSKQNAQRAFVIDTYEHNVWKNYVRVDGLEFVFPLPKDNSLINKRTKLTLLAFYSSICQPFIPLIESKKEQNKINSHTKNFNLKLFPNPSSKMMFVIGEELELSNLKIFDLQGKDVTGKVEFYQKSKNKLALDISDLNSGVYLVKSKSTSKIFCKK